MPPQKVHEPTFPWFGLSGPLLKLACDCGNGGQLEAQKEEIIYLNEQRQKETFPLLVKRLKVTKTWGAANGGLRNGGLRKSEEIEEKGPFPPFSGFSRCCSGPLEKGEKEGRPDTPLAPICYTPICGSPKKATFWSQSDSKWLLGAQNVTSWSLLSLFIKRGKSLFESLLSQMHDFSFLGL